MTPAPANHILPVVVLAQLAGTSLWFVGNAIVPDLQLTWRLGPDAPGHLASAVQCGFIAGTALFAHLAVADRHSPRLVFLACALLGGAVNLLTLIVPSSLWSLLVIRFVSGFFLAGVYPVGMKIVSSWYYGSRSLGHALGFLVGALVVGTALPHLLSSLGGSLSWRATIVATSLLSIAGGIMVAVLVPDGPHHVKTPGFQGLALGRLFLAPKFRAASFGYFGHMWELYAFWTFVPIYLGLYASAHPAMFVDVSLWSFLIIAAGAIGCIGGGLLSRTFGSAPVAFAQLLVSGALCLLSPFLLDASPAVFFTLLIVWGVTVAGDSPQLSALTAATAPKAQVGSALTMATCIGFAITVISIQTTQHLVAGVDPRLLMLGLALGPAFGLAGLWPLLRERSAALRPV